eukprot:TRINITY_DN38051_c0_g1_i1.p1 TRINITY_DN38051_c0_g1~~TRINITY_DN38051_c0_g1_i1.p1  ORF type:complete len:191 (-),score=55.10 TRINITY_DN38051_c0_g1_i1:341-913(-)
MSTNEEEALYLSNHPVLGPIVKLKHSLITKPALWIRKNIVEPNRGEAEPYYHRHFRRVPQIDECYQDDVVCRAEAQEQFLRDKEVEAEIICILRNRFEDCLMYEKGTGMAAYQPTNMGVPISVKKGDHKCKRMFETFEKASENFFIKYGEIGKTSRVEDAYMKQKHRLMWERRHGPIGTGMKKDEAEAAA